MTEGELRKSIMELSIDDINKLYAVISSPNPQDVIDRARKAVETMHLPIEIVEKLHALIRLCDEHIETSKNANLARQELDKLR